LDKSGLVPFSPCSIPTKKSKLDINPLTGEELQGHIREIFKLEPELLEKLKEILK
jgi:hypothetical protein